MSAEPQPATENHFTRKAFETIVPIGAVALLAAWCFDIVKPFIGVLAWAMIIAIALNPVYEWLQSALGGRRGYASILMTLVLLVLLIVPAVALIDTLVTGSQQLAEEWKDGDIKIPAPPEQLAQLPVVGKPVTQFWRLASNNLSAAVSRFKPQIKEASVWLLGAATSAGFALLTFVVAIGVAGLLLMNSERVKRIATLIFIRVAGAKGPAYLVLSRSTIRSVAQGILGVALIQTILAGIGFLAVGIPGAGVLAVMVLVLCIVQLGPGLILIPTVIYIFMTAPTLAAIVYLIWAIFVTLIDNVLKPLLLGRGVDVPVLVVFVGAIGGFLSMGIIGLFVGSIVLVLGYTLLLAWLGGDEALAEIGAES